MAVVCSKAMVKAVACSEVGDEAAVCSGQERGLQVTAA
jgi:hypothetical protein